MPGAGQLLLGLSMGVENANETGYRQAVTPDRRQSRMNTSIRSINRAVIVVGVPVGGLIADAVGYCPMLAAAAALVAGVEARGRSPVRTQHLPDVENVALTPSSVRHWPRQAAYEEGEPP